MNKQDIDKLYYETSDLIMELAMVSTAKGFHLNNDLEGGLFKLLLEEDYREMKLFKARVEYAIKQIKEADKILSDKKVA